MTQNGSRWSETDSLLRWDHCSHLEAQACIGIYCCQLHWPVFNLWVENERVRHKRRTPEPRDSISEGTSPRANYIGRTNLRLISSMNDEAIQQYLVKRDGWYTEEELEACVMRHFLINKVMTQVARLLPYNTEDLKKRYSRLWERYYTGNTVTGEQVKERFHLEMIS